MAEKESKDRVSAYFDNCSGIFDTMVKNKQPLGITVRMSENSGSYNTSRRDKVSPFDGFVTDTNAEKLLGLKHYSS